MAEDGEKTIDFRDSLSTISLLKVSQVFSTLKPSEIMDIRGMDNDTRQDLFKVLPQNAYEILDSEDVAGSDGCIRIRLRKSG